MNLTKQFYNSYIIRYKDGGRIKRFGDGGDNEVIEENVQTSDEGSKPLISTGNGIADVALGFIPGVGLVNEGYNFYQNPTLGNAISLGGEALMTALMFTPIGWGIKGARTAYQAGKGLKQMQRAYKIAQRAGERKLKNFTKSTIKPTDNAVVRFAKNHPMGAGWIGGIGTYTGGKIVDGIEEVLNEDEQYNQSVDNSNQSGNSSSSNISTSSNGNTTLDYSIALKESEEEPEKEYYWSANTAKQIKSRMNGGDTYTVQAYDTPIEIARAAGLTLDELEKYNKQYVSNGKWKTIHAGDVFNLKNPINYEDFKFSVNIDDVIDDNLKQNKPKANPVSTLPKSKSQTVKVNQSLKPSISINEMTDETLPQNQLISYDDIWKDGITVYGKKPKRIGVSVVQPVSLSAQIPTYYPYTANKSYDQWAGAEGII